MSWYLFISMTMLALAAGVCGVLFAAYLTRTARGIWTWLSPKPVRGVFYTQEFDGETKIVRRYVDGKLSAKREDSERGRFATGPGPPISDFEYNLDHGEHADVVKQLRLREA